MIYGGISLDCTLKPWIFDTRGFLYDKTRHVSTTEDSTLWATNIALPHDREQDPTRYGPLP